MAQQSRHAHVSPSEIVRQEIEGQRDMSVRAQRLARYLKATEGKVWCQDRKTGEWTLVSTIRAA
jgi:hypothetical protein